MKNKLLPYLAIIIFLSFSNCLFAQAPTLGTAGNFALFTSSGAVTNTGNSFITGNVGTNTGAVTGFGNVNGVMHTSDGATGAAAADLLTAYKQLNTTTSTASHAPLLGNGDTLRAGVYAIAGNTVMSGNLILDGQNNPNSVFIFKIDAAFATTAASQVILINGAVSCNIFWKIEGMVTMASNTTMRGTVIVNNAAIDMGTGDVIDGRILSTTGAISLNNTSAKIPSGCGSAVLTGPAAPDLASAGCYAIFSGNGEVTNAGSTTIRGDVGTNVGLTTGFNPLTVTGIIHPIPDGSTAAAAADLLKVYDYLNKLPYDIELLYPAQFGNDLVLTPHTYLMNAATSFTGNLYLNAEGNANAVFVLQVNGAFTTSTYAKVILMNGALAKNVYWKVDGAASINDYSELKGTLIVNNGAINLNTGVSIDGRALTTTGAFHTAAVNVNNPEACSVLPVTWLNFSGKAIKDNVLLEWATTNEVNNKLFTIEKSKDAKSFEVMTTVKPNGIGVNNEHHYSFIDEQPYNVNYYRLSQTDLDGKTSYFTTIQVKVTENQNLKVWSYTNGNTIYVTTTGAVPGNGSLELYSTDGKKIASQNIILTSSRNTYQLQKSLNTGMYLIVVKSKGENIYNGKIMIQ